MWQCIITCSTKYEKNTQFHGKHLIRYDIYLLWLDKWFGVKSMTSHVILQLFEVLIKWRTYVLYTFQFSVEVIMPYLSRITDILKVASLTTSIYYSFQIISFYGKFINNILIILFNQFNVYLIKEYKHNI